MWWECRGERWTFGPNGDILRKLRTGWDVEVVADPGEGISGHERVGDGSRGRKRRRSERLGMRKRVKTTTGG